VSVLLRNLLHFGRFLHAAGLDVPAGRMVEVASALDHIDIGRRWDFYFTLQALLVHRHQDLVVFDEAFRTFWRRPPREWSPDDLRALGERRRFGPPEVERPPGVADAPADRPRQVLDTIVQRIAPMSYSSRETSRLTDFAQLTEDEVRQAQEVMAALKWELGQRRTRRWKAGRGPAVDLRRVGRRSVRHGGEPLQLPTRIRKTKRRPLVLLCDVSGSMERYARMMLHFVHSLAGGPYRVEAFLFATRLTRVTRELARGPVETVLKVPRRIPDWGGGTRIGDALHVFNVRWARRVLGHGPIVLLISDGWDRGEPDLVAREMARLQRSCHRLIWLNPLLGSPAYQPRTRGMEAALPFVDDFLPVHNLASLEALGAHLSTLPARRPARSHHARGGHARSLPQPDRGSTRLHS
jgi:uncharacterized protein with von Willebrand factor type A (vWA) domain